MTFFGALGTAVQGITAQATAIGHISDNVANASTIGYKQVNTLFGDLVNNKVIGDSKIIDSNKHMGVTATADFGNRRQGTIIRDGSNTTSIAVNGAGFIPVSRATGVDALTREPSGFEDTTYYTRLGDFRMESSNRLVNSAGFYLQAVTAQPGQTVNLDTATPGDFVVDTRPIAAVPTSTVGYSINLPATALAGKEIVTGIGVIDAESNEQNFQLIWTKTGNNTWDLNINTTQATPNNFGPITYTFNNGVLATAVTADPNATIADGANGAIWVDVAVDYGSGSQTIRLDMGSNGVVDPTELPSLTQYAGEDREASNISINQNGLRGGEFKYVSFEDDGRIMYNYENGRSAIGGVIMLANFREPDRLERLDGTVFTESTASGEVVFGRPTSGTNGVGGFITGALEQSTVDIAEQMTRLMVAQQAYSMNGQVISAADTMLSRAVDMKR
ncbi:flagellar hook-basal body complex protein [Ferrovibrio terrae]|uniref:Flagellar hook protein FlgE n=1 Tax=Ferrovibrio terrae TaxID=2594003 RepID=A0A516H4J5_9PROT|nr:flagellar hook-basal body complex protein [Ferrovibrio terrae]QDO98713.1 flagellar hook-basal body complex protein [Ferrovibrio terrae]